jgi:hypothetical protein
MFEDFENRSGFWKDLGSNFTINYSGDAPSFLTSGEMWQSMDGSETQTLAAWENGWVLMDNPDGSKTATPKYTSGLISQTIVRVPVGPQAPMSSPTGGVGGVQVAYTAEDDATELLDGWEEEDWTLQGIMALCPDVGADEVCDDSPFSEFTVRGTEGTAQDDERWWWVNQNTLGLSNHDGDGPDGESNKSGAAEILIRDGFQVQLTIEWENKGKDDFHDDLVKDVSTSDKGVLGLTGSQSADKSSLTVLMKGGDKLSIDIDGDWSGTANFFLKVQGSELIHNTGKIIDDEVWITLDGVWYDTENPPTGDDKERKEKKMTLDDYFSNPVYVAGAALVGLAFLSMVTRGR